VASLDDLFDSAAKADSLDRMDFRDPIAAFGTQALPRLERWIADRRLGTFAVLTIKRIADLGSLAEARAALQRALPKAQGRTVGDAKSALQALGSKASTGRAKRSAAPVGGSPKAAFGELTNLVARWTAAGRPPQPGIRWPRPVWIAAFPAHKAILTSLPVLLDRTAARGAAAHAAQDRSSAEQAFLVSRAWGEGQNGYGTSRATEIFELNPDVPGHLLKAVRVLRDEGALAAYGRLSNEGDCRLENLGPAFGTKFLYFSQPEGQRPRALIHDAQIAKWFRTRAGTSLGSEGWSRPTYKKYLRTMHDWASDLDCEPDDLEMCIFRSMAPAGSQWAW
jgi:hypothetical protein